MTTIGDPDKIRTPTCTSITTIRMRFDEQDYAGIMVDSVSSESLHRTV